MIHRELTTCIAIHGAWTPPSMDIGAKEITEWHLERGFGDIGYHFVIRRDGTIEEGRDIDLEGAHVYGHNDYTIGICLVGGRNEQFWEFNYTFRQIVALTGLVGRLMEDYPEITAVMGHRDFPGVTKRCPGFDVRQFLGPAGEQIR